MWNYKSILSWITHYIKKMFHVERLQTEEAAANLFVDISEVQQVGSEGANTHRSPSKSMLAYFSS